METINAAANPDLINQVVAQVTSEDSIEVEPPMFVQPRDNVVTLPGGYINEAGEVVTEVEVRELTGKDEEAIVRATSPGRALLTILQRGTVSIGDEKSTDKMLDRMLAGDRDAIMLGIYRATFGNTAELLGFCEGCSDSKPVEVDVTTDIEFKKLADPFDRRFTVKGRKNEYTVELPTGITQKDILLNADKSMAELTTILLENCVTQINSTPVLGKMQVQNLGVQDRRDIAEAIAERNPGPQMQEVSATCPDCNGEVKVPMNLGALFRF